MLYTAERPTLDGNLVTYFPIRELDKRTIGTKAGSWDHYEKFATHGLFMRAIELDSLSRSDGQIRTLTTITDVAGCGFSHLVNRSFDQKAEQLMLRFERLCPDLTGSNWILNAPRFAHKLFRLAKRVLKVKLANWFVCSGSGMHEPELLESVDAVLLAELQASRNASRTDTEESHVGGQHVDSGGVFERVVSVVAGQRVAWSFSILPGLRSLPQAELDFGVAAIWEAPDEHGRMVERLPSGDSCVFDEHGRMVEKMPSGDALIPERTVVETLRYSAAHGEVHGACTAARTGMLILRWSNAFNWVRAKAIEYTVDEGSLDDKAVLSASG